MAKPAPSFESLRDEYAELWRTMQFDPGREAGFRRTAQRIIDNRDRYLAVAQRTGVPWFWIGIVHNMEASLDFTKHLHNGDPLTRRTVQVPKGRPEASPAAGPRRPYTWEESAIDALLLKGLDKIRDWSVERMAYEFERYNGWGYRHWHPNDLSPYLWSGTNHNDGRGKYVADGKWSESAPSEGQSGAMALLKMLGSMANDILVAQGRRPEPSVRPAPIVVEASPAPVHGAPAASGSTLPREEVKRLQTRLRELGYPEVGDLDGMWGRRSRGALLAWKADQGLPLDDSVGPDTWEALDQSLPRGVSPQRAAATKQDLLEKGSPTVTLADRLQKVAAGVGALGVAGKATQESGILGQAQDLSGQLSAWQTVTTSLSGTFRFFSSFFADFWWLLVLAAAGAAIWYAQRIITAKLIEYRKGETSK
jgi:lysozyme family protein